jgi:hypothetical protein
MMPARDNPALDRLATLFSTAAFWNGCIAARSVEDNQRHDEGIARLRALREAAARGEDVRAHPEFDRWLAY